MKEKVLVGMSGGVDSSVTAALLKEQGYDVVGITLKLIPDILENNNKGLTRQCCSLEDVEDARNAAHKLDIPFYVLNFKDIFKEKVIDYFVNSYVEGYTPNPCIACNKFIKFSAMLDRADILGARYIATGHYSVIQYDQSINRYLLKKGKDKKKDQSYVLYMLDQNQLSRILMPLGSFEKYQVREISRKLGFRSAEKPDSQDICFVDNKGYGEYVKENAGANIREGLFVDTDGKVLGKHRGLVYYTVGQRKGLGIAHGEPLYVIEKNTEKNTIILGREKETYKKTVLASGMNYIPFDIPENGLKIDAKTRYSSIEAPAQIFPIDQKNAKIIFEKPQKFIAPGQAIVLYSGDTVVGGGTIEKSFYD